MKYVFKIPFGDKVTDRLVIAHSIFLSSSQRKELHDCSVETIGITVPVSSGEPAREIFCYYKIIPSRSPEKTILPTANGYWIYLNRDHVRSLEDIKDTG